MALLGRGWVIGDAASGVLITRDDDDGKAREKVGRQTESGSKVSEDLSGFIINSNQIHARPLAEHIAPNHIRPRHHRPFPRTSAPPAQNYLISAIANDTIISFDNPYLTALRGSALSVSGGSYFPLPIPWSGHFYFNRIFVLRMSAALISTCEFSRARRYRFIPFVFPQTASDVLSLSPFPLARDPVVPSRYGVVPMCLCVP